VVGIPVMRTPVQILFLILVTDLPPSIALGMEPGDKSILKQRPRPKDEPLVLGWMWFSMVLNGTVLSVVIIAVYVVSLVHYCNGEIFQDDIQMLDGYENRLMNAQTVAFISLVFSENVRSYTSRSFDKPVWQNLWGNPQMQWAILLALVAMFSAVLIPFFSEEILGLRGRHIGWWGWGVALVGPVATLILCELCKIITSFQMQQHQRRLVKSSEAEEATAKKLEDKPSDTRPAAEGGLGAILRSTSFKGPVIRSNSYSKIQEAVSEAIVSI